jgi:hypothetical protein
MELEAFYLLNLELCGRTCRLCALRPTTTCTTVDGRDIELQLCTVCSGLPTYCLSCERRYPRGYFLQTDPLLANFCRPCIIAGDYNSAIRTFPEPDWKEIVPSRTTCCEFCKCRLFPSQQEMTRGSKCPYCNGGRDAVPLVELQQAMNFQVIDILRDASPTTVTKLNENIGLIVALNKPGSTMGIRQSAGDGLGNQTLHGHFLYGIRNSNFTGFSIISPHYSRA